MENPSTIKSFFKYFQRFTFIHLCFAITFFTSGILLNVVQGTLYWSLRYYSKWLYRKINYYLLYTFYCQLVFMSEWWADSQLIIYIDQDDFIKNYGKEHGLLLMNHSFEIDWLMGWQFCEYIQVLGNCKAFAKKSIQYMPPVGWTWKFAEYIFLDRSFQKDKTTILEQIKELGDYPDPVWLLLFAEGTRLSPEKLEASQTFAQDKGLPVLKHHLTPRTRGFIASLQGMKDKINVVYDTQIAFKRDAQVSPTMTNLLFGKPVEAHLYIQRINVNDIPEDEEGAAKWLFSHYEKKDRMQESFYETGSFFENSGVKPIPPRNLPRRIWPVLNTVFWNLLILVPLFSYLLYTLLTGQFLYFFTGVTILGIFYIMMRHLIGMSQIKKASSYGTTKKEK